MGNRERATWAKVALLGFILVTLLAVGCSPVAPAVPAGETTPSTAAQPTEVEAAPSGGEIVFGYAEDTQSFDPHATQVRTAARVMINVCEPLIVRGPDSQFHASLAKSWEIAEDGMTYTFALRDDVTFQDGTPFNAEAVKFNLDRIANPDNKLLAVELLGPYESTEVVDDYTVEVHLTEPFAPLMDGLSKVYTCMVSPAAVQEWGDDFGEHVVGTGPFSAEEIVTEDHVTLVKNPDYNWAPEFFNHQGPAYLDGITFKFIPEEGTRLATLETGEINMMDGVGSESVKIVQDNPDLALGRARYSGTPRSMWLNTQLPPTDSLAVRRALSYAVNRQEIIDTLYKGLYEEATAPLTTSTWSYNPNVNFYQYDPDQAKELMTEDGWELNADGVWEKDGEPIHLVYVNIGGYNLDELAQIIQGQLLRAGFDVEIQTLAVGAWIDNIAQGTTHNIAPTMGDATDPTILRSMFSESMVDTMLNRSKVQGNTELENLLQEQDQESDEAKREELLMRIQEIIMDQAYMIPIYDSVEVYAYDAQLQDIAFDPATHPWFYDASFK